ncbi:MAG: hypothetical protein ACTH1Z_03360 [Ancrocorticia sp.]
METLESVAVVAHVVGGPAAAEAGVTRERRVVKNSRTSARLSVGTV